MTVASSAAKLFVVVPGSTDAQLKMVAYTPAGAVAQFPGSPVDASAGATLAVATALNGAIGYDKATVIVKKATESGRPLREVALAEGVDPKVYDETIDLRRIARGNRG